MVIDVYRLPGDREYSIDDLTGLFPEADWINFDGPSEKEWMEGGIRIYRERH